MTHVVQALVIATDPALAGEIQGAARELPEETRLVLNHVGEWRRGIERAVDRAPELIFLELDDDLPATQAAIREIVAAGTSSKLIAVYRGVGSAQSRGESVLIDLMRAGVADFLRRPVSSMELEALVQRLLTGGRPEASRRGALLSFLGSKGGVGKSTLSTNLACSLAASGQHGRVLLVDASLQHGSVCDLLDLEPENTLADAVLKIERMDERLLRTLSTPHSSGLRVLPAPVNALEAATVSDVTLARILSLARKAFDVVVVDTFPILDPITLAVLDLSDVVHVVTNEFVPTILGTVEMLSVLDGLGTPRERVRIVLNYSHPGFRGRLSPRDVSERLGLPIDQIVPFSRRVLVGTNAGEPYALAGPRWSGFNRAMRRLAKGLRLAGLERTKEVGPVPSLEPEPEPDSAEQVAAPGAESLGGDQ